MGGPNLRIGCCGYHVPPEIYYKRFSVVEVQETFFDPPKQKTLQRWRQKAPSGFIFTVKAWQLITHPSDSPTYDRLTQRIREEDVRWYGSFQPTDQVYRAWDILANAARILEAKVILFQTPASFRPTVTNRKNMERFFQHIDREDFIFVWEPLGVWEDEEVADLCQEFVLIAGIDPVMSQLRPGERFYFRLRGTPRRRAGYTQDDCVRLYRRCVEGEMGISPREGYIIFDTVQTAKDAENFSRWLEIHRSSCGYL